MHHFEKKIYNNEEALLDYHDGLSIALIKSFQQSSFFPLHVELAMCLEMTRSHNKILLQKLDECISHCSGSDV